MSASRLAMGFVALSLSAAGASAALVNSLENPPYTVGDVLPQDGGQWSATFNAPGTHSANIVTSPAAYHGTQSLQLTDGGSGWFDPVRYQLSNANILTAGPTDDGNVSFAFKAGADPSPASQSGLFIHIQRAYSDGQFTIGRGGIAFQSNGDIVFYNTAPFPIVGTDIGDYVGNRWYVVNVVMHTAPDNDTLTADVTVLDTVTNSLVANVSGLAAGNEADRTHWAGLTFSSDSTPPGSWQIDGMTFNAPAVPEPSALSLLGLGALAMLRRR